VITKGSKDISKKSKLSLYAELTKFRLSSLVVVTSGAGFLCGGAPIDLTMMAATCVGTGLCAASAGSFNQIIERHQDAAMNRTKLRPLPSGQLSVTEASAVGELSFVSISFFSHIFSITILVYIYSVRF
jgi:protoheme IX farnesyltransferase